MKIILGGAEKLRYRSILTNNNVPNIALNLSQLKMPAKKEFIFSEQFKGANVWIYTTPEDPDIDRFDSFVRTYENDITGIVGRPDYNGEWLGAKYFNVWSDPKDTERLASLMERFGRVVITNKGVTPRTLPRIRQLQQRWGAQLIGMTSTADTIEALPWDGVIVTSWTSADRYHETQVWDGHSLRRYPASNKDAARKQHRADIIKLGCDFDEVMEDNVDECAKLAVLSWLEWERKAFGPPKPAYDPHITLEGADDDEDEMGQVVAITPQRQDLELADSPRMDVAIRPPDTRHETERMLIPLIGVETVIPNAENPPSPGETEFVSVEVIRTTGANYRNCSSCYLSSVCPQFKPEASCAYKFPIELRTKEQLLSAVSSLIEIQMGRALMESLAEQMEGQGANPAVGKELDRFMNMVAQMKEIQDTRDFIKLSVEGKSKGGGGMAAIMNLFGPKVGEAQNQLPNPIPQGQLDAILSPIIEGEVISDLAPETTPR